MLHIVRYIKSQRPGMIAGASVMGMVALVGLVWSATTIGTSITTDGDLTVVGDATLGSSTSTDVITLTSATTTWTGTAISLFNLLTGNIKVGNGTPSSTLDGEDAYVEGNLEVGSNLLISGSSANLRLGNNSGGSSNNGAIWFDGTNFKGYTGGSAVQLDNAAGGSTETWYTGRTSITGVLSQQGGLISGTVFINTSTLYFTPNSEKTIQSIKYIIVNDAGSYSGNILLGASIVNTSDVVQHTAATQISDMEAATNNTWNSMTLGSGANIVISEGESLRMMLNGNSGTNGDLEMTVLYAVEVQ